MIHEKLPTSPPPAEQTLVIRQAAAGGWKNWVIRGLLLLLIVSTAINISLWYAWEDYFVSGEPPYERFRSGNPNAKAKIAVIEINGTIMYPFTERILKSIEQAQKDENVRAVLLQVDSPGGFVADSHQIYRELKKLAEQKPIAVLMKRMAASGGLYVAMGVGPQGRIFAEETCWTGSIGVIIPHYDMQELGKKVGVDSTPLVTGPYKDSLNPFRELTPKEKEVWDEILDDSFQRFIRVIAENRQPLEAADVEKLATGQIYTATQALENGLIDEIADEEAALDFLRKEIGLEDVRVITYRHAKSALDILLASAESSQPENRWRAMAESTVPQAMYYTSWGLTLPAFPAE